MASNPLRASVKQAQRMDTQLERLFARYIGSAEHPRGAILSAYRAALRSLRGIYKRQPPFLEMEVREVLKTLEFTLQGTAGRGLTEAVQIASEYSEAQMLAYRKVGITAPRALLADVDALGRAWMSAVQGQTRNVATMAAAGAEGGMVEAALNPAQLQREAAKLLAMGASVPWTEEEEDFQRQAIACIDGRTTDCCLAVAGQIVKMDEPFKLTADPRPFGDAMMEVPFHWNCRTSVVLYRPEYDDGVTEEIREQARGEKGRRKELREKIGDVQQELAKLGTKPDARRRKADTKEMKRLRRDMKRLRKELSDY